MAPSPMPGVLPSGSACRRTRPAAGIVASVDISGSSVEQRLQQLAAALLVAQVGDLDDDQVAAAQGLRDHLDGRELEDAADGGDLVGRRLGPVAPGREHALGLLPGPDQPAGEDLLDREELELERRDDAEVAAAAAHGEEEVGLVRLVDAVELAVGRDDLDRP